MKGTFKASKLKSAIQGVVDKNPASSSDDGRMLDPYHQNDVCKTFVCAMPRSSMAAPILFRTYLVRDNASANCFIWEAARATSAAPTFFKECTIDTNGVEEAFVDGGLRCNNPVSQLIEEAGRVFKDRPKACIVSIGTGKAHTIGLRRSDIFQRLLPTDLINALKDIATDCEAAAEEVEKRYVSDSGIYFRFNVDQGLQQVSLAEWDKLDEVTQHTKQYLLGTAITEKVNKLVKTIQTELRYEMSLR